MPDFTGCDLSIMMALAPTSLAFSEPFKVIFAKIVELGKRNRAVRGLRIGNQEEPTKSIALSKPKHHEKSIYESALN
jgi:hypothetical protein